MDLLVKYKNNELVIEWLENNKQELILINGECTICFSEYINYLSVISHENIGKVTVQISTDAISNKITIAYVNSIPRKKNGKIIEK